MSGIENPTLHFACSDDPVDRVASALRLFKRKAIGLKWHNELERSGLRSAISALPETDQLKVRLAKVERVKVPRSSMRVR